MDRRLADIALGITSALLVFAAVPSVLIVLVGDPLPSSWTRAELVSLHGLFGLLAVIAWCSWVICAWSLSRSVVIMVRTRDTTGSPRLADQLALRIAVAVLAIAPAGLAAAGTAGASTAGKLPAAVVPAAGRVSPARRESALAHTVVAGDTLWHVAEDWYGDGAAWPAIANANLARTMRDGTRFLDPSHLHQGWSLAVPALDSSERERDEHEGAGRPISARRAASRSRRPGDRPVTGGGGQAPLPEIATVGAGSLVLALLARRARQVRHLRALIRDEGSASSVPRPGAIELSAVLGPFERSPLLHWVEAALRQLTLAGRIPGQPLPGVLWLRAAHEGVDVHFAAAPPAASPPWVPVGSTIWRLPASLDEPSSPQAGEAPPWCPIVVPVGDDEEATWLLPVAPGACLAVLGPLAGQLVHAMQVAACRWSWHESLVVTTDARSAAEALGARVHGPEEDAGEPHVLFVGDPSVLDDALRARSAVLTTDGSAEAHVSVVVDRHGATVHPYGVLVRPHLLDLAWAGPIADVSPTALPGLRTGEPTLEQRGPTPVASSAPILRHEAGPPCPPAPLRHRAEPSALARVAAPAPTVSAEVRLLVSIPRIDGLAYELPPNRARRATELIAYLALHCPEPVTGDRLRTRVLGSPDIDAAAKTLFNTAHAARRALGISPDGSPLLPPAARAGHYQISPLVAVDARRAETYIRSGLAAPAEDASLALLERGLELIEGEPFAGILSGYGWWRSEGHERQLADLVVDGACALVRGAIAAGQIDRARWALGRARRVEAYSEALTRAAMEVAAASGDAARLHAEWLRCRCQVDELDPGGMPSAPTERLYARLRAQIGTDEPSPASLPATVLPAAV